MNHFHHRAQADGSHAFVAAQLRRQQYQRRPQSFSPAFLQVLADFGNRSNAGGGLKAEFLLNAEEVRADQFQDFLEGQILDGRQAPILPRPVCGPCQLRL